MATHSSDQRGEVTVAVRTMIYRTLLFYMGNNYNYCAVYFDIFPLLPSVSCTGLSGKILFLTPKYAKV